jgi:hypothetical protein
MPVAIQILQKPVLFCNRIFYKNPSSPRRRGSILYNASLHNILHGFPPYLFIRIFIKNPSGGNDGFLGKTVLRNYPEILIILFQSVV